MATKEQTGKLIELGATAFLFFMLGRLYELNKFMPKTASQSMYGEWDNAIDKRRKEGALDGQYAVGGPQQPVDFMMMSLRRER